MKTVADLTQLAMREPLVAAFFGAWKMGEYPTFEQMLIDLSVALAEDRKILIENAVRAIQMDRKPMATEVTS